MIGDLGECDAGRELCAHGFVCGIERATELKPVPPVLHDDGQHECRFAVVADEKRRGILVSTLHLSDVRELEQPTARDDRRVPDFLQVIECAGKPHKYLRPGRIDRSGRGDGVLALEGGEHVAGAYAEIGEPCVGEVDEDAFRPFAQNRDLLYTGYMQ